MALGMFWLFFHIEHFPVGIYLDDTRALKLGDIGLVVTHDAGGASFFGEIHETLEGEIEEVVGGGDQEGPIFATQWRNTLNG